MYSGGKFDLGSILSAIPGRIMRGLSGLVSGLLGSDEESSSTSAVVPKRRPLPGSISRQLRSLPSEED
jgi:hypothetical protein